MTQSNYRTDGNKKDDEKRKQRARTLAYKRVHPKASQEQDRKREAGKVCSCRKKMPRQRRWREKKESAGREDKKTEEAKHRAVEKMETGVNSSETFQRKGHKRMAPAKRVKERTAEGTVELKNKADIFRAKKSGRIFSETRRHITR